MRNWDCPHICDLKDCSFCQLVLEPTPDIGLTAQPMLESERAELNRWLVKVGYGDDYYEELKKSYGRGQALPDPECLPEVSLFDLTGIKPINYVTGQLI